MRLLQVINSTNPTGGGPIEAIRQAVTVLTQQGHVLEIASLDAPDSPWLSELGVKVHALGPAVTPLKYSSRFLPWLKSHASEYDCVMVHGIWLYPSYACWKALRGTPTPYFIYSHGMLDPTLSKVFPFKHLKKVLYWKAVEHKVVSGAKAIFFTGEPERELARNSFRPYQITEEIVPYCVGSPPGDPEQQKRAFASKFPHLNGLRLLVFLSRLHPKKGCDLLIQAFAQVAKQDPALHLVMAGPDAHGYQAKLEAMAAAGGITDRITWTGMLSGDLKWGAFRSADAFVLPSHQENFGIAVVEALACGAPALISNRINLWPGIEQDRAGLITVDTVEGTVDLLKRWLALDAPARDDMRRQALHCFQTRFSATESARVLLATLRSHGVKG